MGQNRNDSLDEEDLAPTDEREAKVRGTAHRAFGVVEEAEDARVVQLGGVVLDEEVACGGVEWRGQLGTQGEDGGGASETDRRTSRRGRGPRMSIGRSRGGGGRGANGGGQLGG